MFKRCCGQSLGKPKYWEGHNSVGVFGGGMRLLVVGCGRILVQWQNPRQCAGAGTLSLCCVLAGFWRQEAGRPRHSSL